MKTPILLAAAAGCLACFSAVAFGLTVEPADLDKIMKKVGRLPPQETDGASLGQKGDPERTVQPEKRRPSPVSSKSAEPPSPGAGKAASEGQQGGGQGGQQGGKQGGGGGGKQGGGGLLDPLKKLLEPLKKILDSIGGLLGLGGSQGAAAAGKGGSQPGAGQ